MAGGYLEWDMDLSNAHGNVNTNFYLTYPPQMNCGINCYCDSGATGGCAELDLTENNGNCWQATTWHPDPSGGDKPGEGQEGPLGSTVHCRAEWDQSGNNVRVTIGDNQHDGNGLLSVMSQQGAVIYSSQWQGWVPGGNRCGSGDLQSSSYAVSNVKIRGSVVQGPEPKLCMAAPEILL